MLNALLDAAESDTRIPYGQEPCPGLEPLVIAWRGRQLRVRHDDPHLGPYTPRGAQVRAAVELASDVEGLRLVLVLTEGERYRVKVADDGSVVGLWRSQRSP